MDEDQQPGDEGPEAPILAAPGADGDADPGVAPEVAFVMPPPAEGAITTADEVEAAGSIAPGEIGGDAVATVLGAIEALGGAVVDRLDGLQARFDREVRAEAAREKVVDRLHAELQEYKQGLLLGVLRPVFVDLIQLHDDIGKMTEGRVGDEGGEAARLLDLIAGVRQGIEDILYRQGVEPFAVDGDAFDPRRQRALATVPNDDPARSRTVAARLRQGFQAGDKVIRPEMVTVYAAPARRDP